MEPYKNQNNIKSNKKYISSSKPTSSNIYAISNKRDKPKLINDEIPDLSKDQLDLLFPNKRLLTPIQLIKKEEKLETESELLQAIEEEEKKKESLKKLYTTVKNQTKLVDELISKLQDENNLLIKENHKLAKHQENQRLSRLAVINSQSNRIMNLYNQLYGSYSQEQQINQLYPDVDNMTREELLLLQEHINKL